MTEVGGIPKPNINEQLSFLCICFTSLVAVLPHQKTVSLITSYKHKPKPRCTEPQLSRYLVNPTRDKAGNIFPIPKDKGEAGGEAWGSLDGWEHYHANTAGFIKPKDPLHLVKRDMLLYPEHISVKQQEVH